MTTGTKVFRIIVCVLLGITMLTSAFFAVLFVAYVEEKVIGEGYGINVAGIYVTGHNEDDILGDGTVYYNPSTNVLTFDNAEIRYDYVVIYSRTNLMIELIGENKFILSGDAVPVIYALEHKLSYDLTFIGDGSLSIEFENPCTDAVGIHAKNIRIETDITVTMPDCSNVVNGIYSEGFLSLANGATVTVNNGAGKYSTAVKALGNINIEMGSTLNITSRPGTTDICKGLNVGGSLIVWDDASLNVSVDDSSAPISECLNVAGLLSVGRNANVTASAKKVCSVECYGSIELNEGASLSASTEGEGVDILCYGSIVNYGATINAEVEVLGKIVNK